MKRILLLTFLAGLLCVCKNLYACGCENYSPYANLQAQPQQGNELSYSRTVYDTAGRVWKTIVLDESCVERETIYTYDKAGKRLSITDPCDNTTYYQYEGNRLCMVEDARGNQSFTVTDALGGTVLVYRPRDA